MGRSFRDLEDLNAQFEGWRTTIAHPREHATTKRIVDEHFAEETRYLLALPAHPYRAVLTVERRISQEGMVAVGGKLRWGTHCETLPDLCHIFDKSRTGFKNMV